MFPNQIAIVPLNETLTEKAKILAEKLQLPLVADIKSEATRAYHFLLVVSPTQLGLQRVSDKKINPFYIDFLSSKLRYRLQQVGLKKELLAKALGCKPKDQPTIIDATAGLARDSFILASLGFKVTMLERSPVLHVLLADALERAANDAIIGPIVARLTLIHAEAAEWLQSLSLTPGTDPKPLIIYLDPMFPERQKTASSKKEMVFLQELLGKDDNSQTLFEAALACDAQRIVVKRPRLAKSITTLAPQFSLIGKSSRFDVYLGLKN